MRGQLETNIILLKKKLATIDKMIQHKPGSRNLKEVRNSYLQAIHSAETTMQFVNGLDTQVLNTVAKLKKTHEVY